MACLVTFISRWWFTIFDNIWNLKWFFVWWFLSYEKTFLMINRKWTHLYSSADWYYICMKLSQLEGKCQLSDLCTIKPDQIVWVNVVCFLRALPFALESLRIVCVLLWGLFHFSSVTDNNIHTCSGNTHFHNKFISSHRMCSYKCTYD